jgi:hypothetical protein
MAQVRLSLSFLSFNYTNLLFFSSLVSHIFDVFHLFVSVDMESDDLRDVYWIEPPIRRSEVSTNEDDKELQEAIALSLLTQSSYRFICHFFSSNYSFF